jgi:hypothetical protein
VLRGGVNFTDGRTTADGDRPPPAFAQQQRDPVDGASASSAPSRRWAGHLVSSLQTANPNEKIVLVGDFNAFPFNDGYVDSMGIIAGNAAAEDEVIEYRASPVATPLVLGDELIADPQQRYSYVFEGNAQTLDHAVVNEVLVNDPAITGLVVEHARINADFREAR